MSADLTKQVLRGDIRALAALMTLIENHEPAATAVLKSLFPHTGHAHVIGVTGAAGVGKSSLIDGMTAEYRKRKKSVGILAVDPSSLFSSGALLGDRIRLRRHFADPGVYIRSFATRGATGGVSAALRNAIHALDAAGKDVVIAETIGVGQDEVEIDALVHTVLLVLVPDMGDEIQAMKAGVTEIADLLVVNKADLPGADLTVQQLRAAFSTVEVVTTAASNGDGIEQLVDAIEKHRVESIANGEYAHTQFRLCREELLDLLRQRVMRRLAAKMNDPALDEIVRRIAERRLDPYTQLDVIAEKLGF
jgi:LAO/AO transport system kinase